MMIQRRSRAILLLALCAAAILATADAKKKKDKGKGHDLPRDAPLRIGIKKRVAPEDCGRKAIAKDRLKVHYVGRLYKDNKKFDSSWDRDQPFEFTLGVGEVIQGWDQGLHGMCVGERRKLVVPADLAYGDAGAGSLVPAGATLIFKVVLLENDGPEPPPPPPPEPEPEEPEEPAAAEGEGDGSADTDDAADTEADGEEVLDLDADDDAGDEEGGKDEL